MSRILVNFEKNVIEKESGFWYNKFYEYEQIVNSQILGRKKLIARIFCELHVKMGSGSRCLCGLPDLTVEMGEARFRALTLDRRKRKKSSSFVEMGEARFRALTQVLMICPFLPEFVEMGEARFRALTRFILATSICFLQIVEMGEARFRALTQEAHRSSRSDPSP